MRPAVFSKVCRSFFNSLPQISVFYLNLGLHHVYFLPHLSEFIIHSNFLICKGHFLTVQNTCLELKLNFNPEPVKKCIMLT
jgi:hypothetical protein